MRRDVSPPRNDSRRAWLLGGFRVEDAGGPISLPRGQPRQLLARLVLTPGLQFSREQLAEVLWPEADAARASRYLSNALYRLRKALGDAWLETDENRVAVRVSASLWVDAGEFERLAKSQSPADWQQAIALYTGDLLPEVYHGWVLLPRLALREHYLRLLRQSGARAEHKRQWTEAADIFHRLVAADTYDEAAVQGLMRSLAGAGRIAAALDAHARYTAGLAAELGLSPTPETQTLAERLRAELAAVASPGQARPDTPFIGRRAERGRLIARLDRARAGRGGLVVVMGEAGIGKTRLLDELAEAAQWRGWHVARGRGDEFQSPGPDEPLRHAMQTALPAPRWQQLERLLPSTWLVTLGRWLPAPNAAAAETDPGQLRPSDLPQALRQSLSALQTIAPHLLLLDDVQWADPAVWRLMDDLREGLHTMAVLFVLAGRLDELQSQPFAWERITAWDQQGESVLVLRGLPPDEVRALVAGQVSRDLAEVQLADLVTASGGNPLLALELAQADDLEGLLSSRPSLAALAQRSLAPLSAPARMALNAGAAIGYHFEYTLWERVLAANAFLTPTLPALAGELERAGLLVITAGGYRFRHDTLRAATYLDMPDPQRTRWHQLILAELETLPAATPTERLHHATKANDRPAMAQHARQAGDQALASYGYRAAAGYYQQALDALPAEPEAARFEALSRQITALRVLSDRTALQDAVPTLRALADALGNPALQAEAALQEARYQWQVADFRAAREAAEQGMGYVGDDLQRAELCTELGRIARDLSDYPAAQAWLEQARQHYRTLDSATGLAAVSDLLGIVAQRQDRAREAIALHTEAVELFDRIGDRRSEAHSVINLGIAHQAVGDFVRARLAFERGAELCRAMSDARAETAALINLGGLASLLGDYESALEAQARGLALARAAGNRQFVAMGLSSSGITLAALGRLDEALAQQTEALELNRALGRPRGEGYCLQAIGEALLEVGRFAEAQATLEEAERVRRQLDEPDNLMITRAYLALAHLGQNRLGPAQETTQAALSALDDAQDSPDIRRDVHFCAYRVALATDAPAPALAHLCAAEAAMHADSLTLPPADRERFLQRVPHNRRVRAALAAHSRTVKLNIARAGTPLGRPLEPADYVAVEWTISAPGDALIPAKDERRRHVIRRLLTEAEAQGAAPTDGDLATALGVSRRTIERDMAALQAAGRAPVTRRRKPV